MGILSAGIIPVRFGEDGVTRLLLLRAYHYWDFPKGRVEPGETPLDAAKRELKEETTLEKAVFAWGEEWRETPPYAGGKVARYYLARIDSGSVSLPVSEELGRPEHDEYRWVTEEEARVLVAPRLIPVLDWAHAKLKARRARGRKGTPDRPRHRSAGSRRSQ